MRSGLYLVTLRNIEPISVNRGDRRIEHRCIRVTREHCKFGKARDFARRRAGYLRVFGEHNVRFVALFGTEDVANAERAVLAELAPWRMRGHSGRRNEWLAGIAPGEVERIAERALRRAGIAFGVLGRVNPLSVPIET
jgi:hypothetical protein